MFEALNYQVFMLLYQCDYWKCITGFAIWNYIVFGVRTPIEDKRKIIDILNRKCKENNRKNFPVYQAQYDKSGNYIKKVLLMNLPYDE